MLRKVGLPALRIAVVALAYLLAGRLLRMVELPAGYATAVWPPAGIAVASAILWGPSVLVGVWIGAYAVHLTRDTAPLTAAWLSCGAALQAAAGLWITRCIAKRGNPFEHGEPGLRALLFAGPLSCLVSATWCVATLVAVGRVDRSDAAFNWASWWAGDTIGVLLFLPPVLAWTAQPVEIWRRRRWTLAAPLLACFVGVVAIYSFAQKWDGKEVASQFQERKNRVAQAIHRELQQAVEDVIGLGAFFDASNNVERGEFALFTAQKLRPEAGMRAFLWAPVVRAEERAAFEDKAKQDGVDDFVMKERTAGGGLQPAADRARYLPIKYIEPLQKYRDLVGLDVGTDPVRAATIDSAIQLGTPTVSPCLRLLKEVGPGWGVWLMMPVYREPKRPVGRDRGKAIYGLAIGVLEVDALVRSVVSARDLETLAVRVRDPSAPSELPLLYGDEPKTPHENTVPLAWDYAGRRWQIEIEPAGPPVRSGSSWLVLVIGLLITSIFVAFVLDVATRQTEVERLVALRTRELGRANDELQRSNIELQRFAHVASHDLREPLRALGSYAQLLNESADALTPEHRKFLERIVQAAHRMQTLVDDLLALSRIEGSTATMFSVPLRPLVDLALENLEPRIAAAGATVEVGELPTATCDASPIVQLFQNLVANAVKFRRQGVAPHVRIDGRRVGRFWELSVRDNGIGIAPEHRERVFEMFERLHPRERYGGTGIGLAICRKIVERHGGRIWVESSPEGGSVFRFTLRAEGGTE